MGSGSQSVSRRHRGSGDSLRCDVTRWTQSRACRLGVLGPYVESARTKSDP